MKSRALIVCVLLVSSCVKQQGAVGDGAVSGGSTSGTNNGNTTGSPATGSDPLASAAWHLKNTGQNGFATNNGTSGQDIGLEAVHLSQNLRGRNVRIAVSDTGIQTDHPDLAGNLLSTEHRNYTYANPTQWSTGDPYPSDGEAHGTAVTGLVCALGWNNIGSRGVAPSAKVAGFRYIFDQSPTETEASLLAKEIDQTYGNFDIFNYSYGYSQSIFSPLVPEAEEAWKIGTESLRSGRGALYVQSAGNSFVEPAVTPGFSVSGNTNITSELSSPYKIVVGAVNANGVKSSYSTPGASIWVSAPGGEDGITNPAMISTDIMGCTTGISYFSFLYPTLFNFGSDSRNPDCDYTNQMNGTSSAAPVTTGVIALMLEARPELKWRDIKHILAATAVKVDYNMFANVLTHPRGYELSGHIYDYKWVTNDAGYMFSNWYGFGRINATAAVNMAKTFNLSTMGTFEQTTNSDGTWYYDSGALAGYDIVDENANPLEHKIWVAHNYIVENIQIELSVSHPYDGELGIILESPGGTESRLLPTNSMAYGSLSEFTMGSNAFYGEESGGWWTIKIVDGNSNYGTGSLTNWKLLVNGHRKSTELMNPYPVNFLTLGTVPLTSDWTPIFTFTHSISLSTLTRYEARVEKFSDGTVVQDWTSIALDNSGQLTGLALMAGETYALMIRAVSSGGTSGHQLFTWVAN